MAEKRFWAKLTSQTKPPPTGTLRWSAYKLVTRFNVWIYRRSDGRVGGRFDDAPICILHHRGAKTGAARETPLVFCGEGDNVILIASMGGQPRHPAWFHNLRAHSEIEIERDGRRAPMTARVTDGDERERLWQLMLTVWPTYDVYQSRTDRVIPVILCAPRSP